MKMKNFLVYAGMILVVVCMLALTGCPQDSDPEAPAGLKGTWSNGKNGGLNRTFTINDDFTFETIINPACIAAGKEDPADIGLTPEDTTWEVTGALALLDEASGTYTMTGLKEENGVYYQADPAAPPVSANIAVKMMDDKRVTITFDGNDKFVFAGADSDLEATANINQFFGDTYTRQK